MSTPSLVARHCSTAPIGTLGNMALWRMRRLYSCMKLCIEGFRDASYRRFIGFNPVRITSSISTMFVVYSPSCRAESPLSRIKPCTTPGVSAHGSLVHYFHATCSRSCAHTLACINASNAPALGARLKPNVVPAKLFQCSRLSGRNKKSSKFIYPPTKPTRTWWQNMLFASLGGPRWYAHICCLARCHVKKTCFQKEFLSEHHWKTARTSYWNVAGTSTLQQEQSTRKGKMVTYIVV